MSLGERVLLFSSRDPNSGDYGKGESYDTVESALCLLSRVYPDLPTIVTGKRILDFGCGAGYQCVALAKFGANFVMGVDTNANTLAEAQELGRAFNLEEKVKFSDRISADMRGAFDIVISQNSMEHFSDPALALNEMTEAITPEGRILITFGPPWHAPYGSHMQFFTRLPWVNIVFSEKTVMTVRSRYRNDGAMRYEEVESGLNKITIRKFERLVHEFGLRMLFSSYDCVKGWNFLGSVPLIRELFINHVTCMLCKARV